MNKKNFILVFLIVSIIFVFITACDGGDSGPNASGGDPPSSGIINPGLSGIIFFTEDDEAWRMNISTGKYTKIDNTNWSYQRDRFPRGGLSRFYALPIDYDKSEFVVVANNCKDHPERSCVVIQDENGDYSEQFEVFGKVSRAILSRDRQYIALFRRSISTDSQLEIRDRSGSLISYSKLDRRDFAWLPDGRIIYGVGRSFYFTLSYSTQIESILTLPENMQGTVRQVAVNYDASRLFFTMEGPRKGGTFEYIKPYIMNVDGSGIRQLATTPDDAPLVGDSSVWSPDGQWILLREGGAASAGSANPGFNGYFYLVPTQGAGQMFMLSPVSVKRSSEVRLLRRYSFSDNPDDSSGNLTDRSFANDISWLP